MSVSETVVRQSWSYRRGLVLGLTMAEVILLIVFALLIALAAVWRAEHQEMLLLREKLNLPEITGSLPEPSPSELGLFAKLRELLRSPKRDDVKEALERIASEQTSPTLADAETRNVSELKDRMRGRDPSR